MKLTQIITYVQNWRDEFFEELRYTVRVMRVTLFMFTEQFLSDSRRPKINDLETWCPRTQLSIVNTSIHVVAHLVGGAIGVLNIKVYGSTLS